MLCDVFRPHPCQISRVCKHANSFFVPDPQTMSSVLSPAPRSFTIVVSPGMANKKRNPNVFIADVDVDEAEVVQASVGQDMIQVACDLGWVALKKFTSEGEMARFLKQYFDRTYGATWICVVGKTFGSYISVDSKYFIHIHIGKTAILLYKTFSAGEYERISRHLDDRLV
uniref:Dynein light chain n=1 Tax=Panagrellus redivivus TaxID=6233 RepID=A0A7E4UUI1_PANRE